MNFEPNNKIVQLCIEGMGLESEGKVQEAADIFLQAWADSTNDFEKFTSAHYVARHQMTLHDKLKWDETSLHFALQIMDDSIKAYLPSLYLNIAKCHEDLNDFVSARKQYQLALSYFDFLPDDGYGKMIKLGVGHGFERISMIRKCQALTLHCQNWGLTWKQYGLIR